jgi:hypothetical protein
MSALSELVALAHFTRAKERARRFALDYGTDTFIYRGRGGFLIDTKAPEVSSFWQVSPSGTVTETRRACP